MFKSLARAVLCVTIMVAVAGCYSVKIVRPEAKPASVQHMVLVHTFLFGIVSVRQVNVTEICGDNQFSSIHSRIGGLGLLANVITGGLWAPMSVTVVCAVAPNGGGMTELPDAPDAPTAELPDAPVATLQ